MENRLSEAEIDLKKSGTVRKPRRYSAEEKARLLAEAEAPGSSMTMVSRKYGVAASALFRWRQLRDSGSMKSLETGEAVVAESELKRLKAEVRELQRLLGKKTQEAEILRDAIEVAREKKLLSPGVLSKLDDIL